MLSFDKEYDGWPPERIARHVLYWSFWLTFYGVVNGTYYGGNQYFLWFLYELTAMTVKLPYAYIVAYVLFPKFLPQGKYLSLIVYVLFLAAIGTFILIFLSENFPYEIPTHKTGYWSSKTFYRFVDLLYIASPVVAIKMIQQYVRQKRTNAQLKEEKIGAELQILKNQLQPHFLFNTLNNIYGMVLSGEKKAADLILKLSDIISYMLYECNEDLVRLDKDIEMLKNYIELEKIRYGDRLDLSFTVQGDPKGKKIPPLLLIPFIENAFKHGVSKNEKNSWVRINLQIEENALSFMVENSLPTNGGNGSALKSGIGLQNVRKRLELLYPERHKISISNGDSFLINMKITL